ncbi:MAG: tetratricopeptide repeat protein [Pseudomonadales bacterium]|nr:tetratricopeptide repeat protein [Pseudomonadales bacterium]
MLSTRLFALLLFVASLPSLAQASVEDLQTQWAQVMYATDKDAREAAFDNLSKDAEALVQAEPDNAGAYIWQGIILSTYAGEKGGLGALGLVKQARAALEKALRLDPDALAGSAWTSLGSLYYQVPGWPISFGDKDKAREYLQKALASNPDGIDPNYFMADFLVETGKYAQARDFVARALAAPDRPGRELADKGRRGELLALQARIDSKLK